MRYLSVCSGIEAASVAWASLGWKAAAFSEIDAFPRAVLQHHYPDTPLHGDFSTIKEDEYGPIDLLVGGTPCQSFSLAGLRRGLDDDRGNLALEFIKLARRTRPRWLVWENVPGVLSSLSHTAPDPCPPPPPLDLERDGQELETEDDYAAEELHAFQCFLAGLSEIGYGFSYRTFDAQYAGVAQRRRRVFVVGYLGDWRPAAAVLFERESLSGNPPPRREAGAVPAALSASGVGTCGADDNQAQGGHLVAAFGGNNTGGPIDVATACRAKGGSGHGDFESETFVATVSPPIRASNMHGDQEACEGHLISHTQRADGFDAGEDGTGRGTPLVPIAFTCKDYGADAQVDHSPTLRAMNHDGSHANAGGQIAIAIQERAISENLENGPQGKGFQEGTAYTLEARNKVQAVAFDLRGRDGGAMPEGPHTTANIRAASGRSSRSYIAQPMAVRRLTPRECERLQGFPDDYTLIPYRNKPADKCPDGPRYKALGNSMAVPVMGWIGERIAAAQRVRSTP